MTDDVNGFESLLLKIDQQVVTHIRIPVCVCVWGSAVVPEVDQVHTKALCGKLVSDTDPVIGHTEKPMKYQDRGTAAYYTGEKLHGVYE